MLEVDAVAECERTGIITIQKIYYWRGQNEMGLFMESYFTAQWVKIVFAQNLDR